MDIDRYFARIGLSGPIVADPAGIAALQSAHRLNIGFENLDAMLGRPILIDSASVFEKLVLKGRGGYCFEHNRLYADVLAALGLPVRPLLARVRLGIPEDLIPPRTHVLLLVTMGGREWIADAGFGGSDLPPLPLEDGAQAQTPDGARHRLRRMGDRGTLGGEWLLERAGPAAATDGRAAQHSNWQAQYIFDLSEVAPVDLEQANHWTSTRPETRFTTVCIATIPQQAGFASLAARELTVHGPAGTERRVIADQEDYLQTLRKVFRIQLGEKDMQALSLFS